MALGGDGQEGIRDPLIDIDGGDGQGLGQRLDLLVKLGELMRQNGLKDPLQLLVVGEGEIEHVELGLDSLRDLRASSAGWAHTGHNLHVENVLKHLLLQAVEPSLIIKPLSQYL